MRANAHELLQALAGAPEPTSVHAMRVRLGIGKDGAHRAIHVLVRRGLATQARYGFYRITDEGRAFLASGRQVNRGRHARSPRSIRTDTFRARLWRAARVARRFTINDLVQITAGPEDRAPRSGANRYIKALERAGILRRLPGPRNQAGRWLLLRDIGPRPPAVNKRATAVFDPNSGETHDLTRSA